MARYTVTWGEEVKTIRADSEADAWTEFAKGNDTAYRHPHLYDRSFEVLDEYEQENPVLPGE